MSIESKTTEAIEERCQWTEICAHESAMKQRCDDKCYQDDIILLGSSEI